jgi:hypothetical protein
MSNPKACNSNGLAWFESATDCHEISPRLAGNGAVQRISAYRDRDDRQ